MKNDFGNICVLEIVSFYKYVNLSLLSDKSFIFFFLFFKKTF